MLVELEKTSLRTQNCMNYTFYDSKLLLYIMWFIIKDFLTEKTIAFAVLSHVHINTYKNILIFLERSCSIEGLKVFVLQ